MRIFAYGVAVIVATSCSFSPATAPVNGDASKPIDAAPLPDTPGGCTATCNGANLVCGSQTETCQLGCVTTGARPHCAEFTPANGASWDDLASVSQDLNPIGDIFVHSDDGLITFINNTSIVRPAGDGLIAGWFFRSVSSTVSLLAVDDFTVIQSRKVIIVGSKSLIILVRGTATIAGEIDVDAGDGGARNGGPGGGDGAMVVGAIAAKGCGAGQSASSSSGGAGGSFGTKGGDGGGSRSGAANPICTEPLLSMLRGGSGGGAGGDASNGGSGGGGGGAVQITSRKTIDIASTAKIHANGFFGQSTQNSDGNGGGGGGSGGGILLQAPAVHVLMNAAMTANGGGGGGGKNQTDGQAGKIAANAATGGDNGGNGGCLLTAAKNGTGTDSNGGGGGGGAVGKVEIVSYNISPVESGGIRSPNPVVSMLMVQ
jgi:hypothetical protein